MGPPVGEIVLIFAFFVFGLLLGWLASDKMRRGKISNAQEAARQIIAEAQQDAEALKKTAILEARDEWRRERTPLEKELENLKFTGPRAVLASVVGKVE